MNLNRWIQNVRTSMGQGFACLDESSIAQMMASLQLYLRPVPVGPN